MGKSSKKSNLKVDAAPAVVAPTKPMQKGKREAEAAVEKVSAKKQKKDSALEQAIEKKKADAKIQKKKVESSSSSSDDDSSDSEEELKKPALKTVAAPKKPVVAKNGKLSSSSDESDSDSDEEMPAAKKAPAPKGKSAPVKTVKKEASSSDSSSDDSSSDEEMPAAKNGPAPKGKSAPAASIKKKDSSSDSSSDDSDEEMPDAKKGPAPKGKTAPKKESSSEDDSSSDEDAPVAKKVPDAKKAPAPKGKIASKKDSSSEDDSSSDEDAPVAKKVPAKNGAVKPKQGESSSEEDSSSDEEEKVVKKPAPTSSAPTKKVESSSDDDSSDESSDDEPSKAEAVKKSSTGKKESSSDDSSSEESSDEEEDAPSKTPKKGADVKMVDAPEKKVPKTPVTPKAESQGSKSLFMGNLSWSIEQADVENFFKDCGEVKDVRFASHPDGTFKGYGHVEFTTSEAALKALELNGQELMGREVKLDLAKERGAYTPNSGKFDNSFQKQGRGGGESTTVFVKGFDKNDTEDKIRSALEDHFGSCGEIKGTRIPTDPEGYIKGMAYVEFTDNDAVNKALELNNSQIGNNTFAVSRPMASMDAPSSGSNVNARASLSLDEEEDEGLVISIDEALELNDQQLLVQEVELDLAKERGADTPNSGEFDNSFQKQGSGGGESSSEYDDDDSSDESEDGEPQKKNTEEASTTETTVKQSANDSKDETSSEHESSDDEPSEVEWQSSTGKESSSDDYTSEESSDEEEDAPSKTPNKQKTPVTSKAESQGSRSLFMGNLSWSIVQADVENFFKDCGEVKDVRFASHRDGMFKGYGHVEFTTSEAAAKALELNGQQLLGREVRLNLAKERGAYTPNSGKFDNSFQKQGRGGGESTIVFVKGFDKNDIEDKIRSALEDHFGSCGEIKGIRIPTDPEGYIKGMAYIEFTDNDAMNKALELNNSQIGNNTLLSETMNVPEQNAQNCAGCNVPEQNAQNCAGCPWQPGQAGKLLKLCNVPEQNAQNCTGCPWQPGQAGKLLSTWQPGQAGKLLSTWQPGQAGKLLFWLEFEPTLMILY
nr:nucleolin 1 [Ipomoea batatas]